MTDSGQDAARPHHRRPAAYPHLRSRIAHLIDSMDRPPVIGISGHGGAGKSTLAGHLMTDLGGTPPQVIRTDRFYAPGAGPDSGLFDLHDWPALLALLRSLRDAPPPPRIVHRVRTYDGIERLHDTPLPPVVIVEGIRLFQPETMPLFDLSVWIGMSPESAGRRAVERNRAQGDTADELALWRTKWIPEGFLYETTVNPERLADVVLPAVNSP